MRLIDAERIVYSWIIDKDGEEHDGITLQSIIDKMPTVDAVPLEDYQSMERTVNKLRMALADAEPVKHGHWIFEPKDAIEMMFTLPKCSECGAESSDGGNYCPNCGAKMDEVEDG